MSMSGGSSGAAEEPISSINITPLVDVSLVLVIIFMVTAPLISRPKLSVMLPKASTDESKNEENVTITIDKDSKIAVDSKTVTTLDEMKNELARKIQIAKEKVIIIKADESVDYGTVIDAMDAAKDSKPKKMYFATQQKK